MKVKAFDINLELFGAEFANMDSKDQAKFFNGMAKELLTWETKHRVEMQFCYVIDDIKPECRDVLKTALGMLIYEEAKQ